MLLLISHKNHPSLELLKHLQNFNRNRIVVYSTHSSQFELRQRQSPLRLFDLRMDKLEDDFLGLYIGFDIGLRAGVHQDEGVVVLSDEVDKLLSDMLIFLQHEHVFMLHHKLLDCSLAMVHDTVDEVDLQSFQLILN